MIYEKKLATMSINLIWTNDVNADDSDCEEVQLPEFDPEYESEDDVIYPVKLNNFLRA